MQLSNRQVTGFVNGVLKYCWVVDGIMQDSNQHMLGGVWYSASDNTLTGLIYVGPRATHFSLLGILVLVYVYMGPRATHIMPYASIHRICQWSAKILFGGWWNSAGFKSTLLCWAVWYSASGNTLTGLIYVGHLLGPHNLLGILVLGYVRLGHTLYWVGTCV
jgi:hypothetical protein